MKAAILVETNQPLVIADIELPESLLYGQVLVALHYSGICGSQINEIYAAKGEDKYLPHLLGHEGVGVVQDIGPGVTQVKKGDTVILHWRPTSRGIQAPPPKYRWKDKVVNAGWVTTFNEQAVVSENRLTVLTEKIDLRLAPLFGCAIPTAFGVVNHDAKITLGQSVVVFGLGGIGLSIVQGAELVSAQPIIGIDVNENKLQAAKPFGLTAGFLANDPDLREKILNIVGVRGADVVIDTTGNPRVIELAYQLTHPEGKTILVGVPKKGENISIYSLPLHFNQRLLGSHGGGAVPDRDIPRYLKLLKTGKLKLTGLVSHEFGLNDINKAIAVVRSNEAGRVIIRLSREV